MSELPTPPAGLAMVVQATGNPDTPMQRLAGLISKEPSLTTALLKLSNSAAFGVGREIRTVAQAAVLLGTRAIRNIAVSHVVRVATQNVDAGEFELESCWEESRRRATAALVLSLNAGYEYPSEAFTIGLVQDLGTLVLAVRDPSHSRVLRDAQRLPGPQRLAEERRVTGTTHPEVFLDVGRTWGLPQDMIDVVGLHHNDLGVLEDRRAARLLEICRAADALADLVQTNAAQGTVQRATGILAGLASREPLELEAVVDEIAVEMEAASEDMAIQIREQPGFKEVMAGANEALIQINLSYEELTQKLESLLQEKEELTRQLKSSNEALKRLAATDVLTGVANRRAFTGALDQTLRDARASAGFVTFLMLDIDHFKDVNDTYGHQAGDDVLKEVCRRMARTVRAEDLVGRLGGEEFGVLLPECPPEVARTVGERLRECLKEGAIVCRDGTAIPITGSFGGWTVKGPELPGADDILKRADEALYESKEGGRDRVTWAGGAEA